MSEGEVVEQLVEFTNILLLGVSVFFTVVSAYIAALNYFIGQAAFIARFLAFLFVTVVLLMLGAVMMGGQLSHEGLIARLDELNQQGALSAAGRALLANSADRPIFGIGLSLDDSVRLGVWTVSAVIYASLFYLTFFHRWRPDIVPVSLQPANADQTD
ncbi:MAG: hypothetical protein HXY28_12605 [Hydrogenophilaceae bacterium]|jgi:hypothetical protein|nr:hypothetical protein [Hydrogenophilaceae bacterium]